MDDSVAKHKIVEKALALGFEGAGVCDASPIEEFASKRFEEWLRLGMADKMDYMARNPDKRFNPKLLFEKAESVLALAANFFRPCPETRIATYAQGADYHGVIKAKLQSLAAFMAEMGGEQKICVDTSPIAEKLLAQRAGLGWIGKNTLLIRRLNGPWSFIGLILTSLKLPPDAPFEKSLCGACDKCLKACPTAALTPNGLDARKCISNLSIERSALSQEEKALLGDKLFGCDECLRACPFGKNAPRAQIEEFRTAFEPLPPSASREDLKKICAGTPIARAFRGKS